MTWHIDELARGMQEEERKPNPVVQRVKVIMSLGLVVVHLHSRFLSQVTGVTFGFPSSTTSSSSSSAIIPNSLPDHQETDQVSLQQYLWWKLFNFSMDQVVTITLIAVLLVKYIIFDKNVPSPRDSAPSPSSPPPSLPQTPLVPFTPDLTSYYIERRRSLTNPPTSITTETSQCYSNNVNTSSKDKQRGTMVETADSRVPDRSPTLVSVAVQTDPPPVASFMFDGDFLSDEEDEERAASRRTSEVRAPRPVEECLRIFKSEVS